MVRTPKALASVLFSCTVLLGCVTPREKIADIPELQTMLRAGDPIIGGSLMLVGIGGSNEHAVCNGVYVAKGVVLTAAHCLVEDLRYHILVPTTVERKDPFTKVKFTVVEARRMKSHEKFAVSENEGFVTNDIGVVYFDEPKTSLLRPISILPEKQNILLPKNLHWRGGDESYFEGDTNQNQVLICGYKVEKDRILKGMWLIKDATNLIGFIKSSHSALISLNPGTSIHKGVSGSGVFVQRGDQYYLVGITSHFFPGINLLAATHAPAYRKWLDERINEASAPAKVAAQ